MLGLIAPGLTNKEIGHSLGITERGAAAHVSRLLACFRVPNRAGLIARTLSDAIDGRAGNTAADPVKTVPLPGVIPESAASAAFGTRRASIGTDAFREASTRAFRTGHPTTIDNQRLRWLPDDRTWSTGSFSCVLQPEHEATGNFFGLLWICMPT